MRHHNADMFGGRGRPSDRGGDDARDVETAGHGIASVVAAVPVRRLRATLVSAPRPPAHGQNPAQRPPRRIPPRRLRPRMICA